MRKAARWYRWSEALLGYPGWIELADDWAPLRQVEKPDGWDVSSWYGWRESGCKLAEPSRNPAEMHRRAIESGELFAITQDEFNSIWRQAIESRLDEWTALKRRIRVGQTMTATTIIFYPQGALVRLGEPFSGLISKADHDAHFADRLRLEPARVGWSLPVRVAGFDDEFQWVLLTVQDRGRASGGPSSDGRE